MCVECVGYILEELRDEGNYEQFKKDMAEANIFIGSLIFVQVSSSPPSDSRTRPDTSSPPTHHVVPRLSAPPLHLQELADKVVAVVEPERERLDAVCVFPSMPDVMRLNKIGSFTMASMGQSKNVMVDFMKKNKPSGTSFQDGMLKLVRTLPKVRSPCLLLGVACSALLDSH